MPVKPKAKISNQKKTNEEKRRKIISHHEHKRRLDTRKMLVISIPLKISIKISNTCHLSSSRQNMLYNRKMDHYTIAMPNQYEHKTCAHARAHKRAPTRRARALLSAPMIV